MWISLKSHSKEGVLSVGPSSAKSRSQLSLFKTKSSDYVIICVRVLTLTLAKHWLIKWCLIQVVFWLKGDMKFVYNIH